MKIINGDSCVFNKIADFLVNLRNAPREVTTSFQNIFCRISERIAPAFFHHETE
jgi:hypothetical protein